MAQDWLQELREVQPKWCWTPIIRKGENLGFRKASTSVSTGKTPWPASRDQDMTPEMCADEIERRPEKYSAAGVWCGPRSGGLACVDVDEKLGAFLVVHGESLKGAPCIRSTKKNAAKYLVKVPLEHWEKVSGFGLEQVGEGYEVLWEGRQAVLYGEYPGKVDSKTGEVLAPEGEYELVGDLENVPDAPKWLLEKMADAREKVREHQRKEFVYKSGLTKNPEEEALKVEECLALLDPRDFRDRDDWVMVGMCIEGSGLAEGVGLELWSNWSKQDEQYADHWKGRDNPCEPVWRSFDAKAQGEGGARTLGTLVKEVRRKYPEYGSYPKDRVYGDHLPSEEEKDDAERVMRLVSRIKKIRDPGKQAYELQRLASGLGMRDSATLEKIHFDHTMFRGGHTEVMSLDELSKVKLPEYIIPGLLPCPSTVLFHGLGGTGKSSAMWALAIHVVKGTPFNLKGTMVPVDPESVLILNGDQSLAFLAKQLASMKMEFTEEEKGRLKLMNDWSFHREFEFIGMMNKFKPKLVLIDSVSGCNAKSQYQENQAGYAHPLYWLSKQNGRAFPGTTILLLHHDNKAGSFRGTSALRDAVDETWHLQMPRAGDGLTSDQRLLVIEKSRSGEQGTEMVMCMRKDLVFTLEARNEAVPDPGSVKATYQLVLNRLQARYPDPMTAGDIAAEPMMDMTASTARMYLKNLKTKGLVEVVGELKMDGKGRPAKLYRAVVAAHS
jgi:hypothetical protein